MLVAAIAAEYNPFHNGHAYQIAKTRKAGATHIVSIMSGNFTQRGSGAIAEKRVRAAAALKGGVDLVVELPLPYAMATAQRFAFGVATIAHGMGCIEALSFGSESGYVSILQAAANAVDNPDVIQRMEQHLATGVTFAKARQTAISELCGDEIADMLGTPNDALGVEYIRQLKAIGSNINPFVVHREGVMHDEQRPNRQFASASFLRGLTRTGGVETVGDFMPPQSLNILLNAVENGLCPFDDSKIEPLIFATLRRMSQEEYSLLPDVSEGLENRIYSAARQAVDFQEIHTFAKSKRYTAARIRRVIMSAFLNVPSNLSEQSAPYIRVLAFNQRGREVLARLKETSKLPISDSLAYLRKINPKCQQFADLEARATDLYFLGLPKVLPCGYDFTANSVRDIKK